MTGLDTNALVRYLVQDDPAQSLQASGVIEAALTRGERLYLSRGVTASWGGSTKPQVARPPSPSIGGRGA